MHIVENAKTEMRYQVNQNFILREIAGEALLVPVGEAGMFTNSMVSLNLTSLFLWKQFTVPNTIGSVIHEAQETFDDPSGKMEDEIRQCVLEYVKTGLLKEVLSND